MAYLSGVDATYSLTSGETLPSAARCAGWQINQMGRRANNVTPIGYVMEKYDHTIIYANGTIDFYVNDSDSTPPLPANSTGTLVLNSKTSEGYTFRAQLSFFAYVGARGQGGPQQLARYQWVASANTSASDTITVA